MEARHRVVFENDVAAGIAPNQNYMVLQRKRRAVGRSDLKAMALRFRSWQPPGYSPGCFFSPSSNAFN